MSDINKIIEAVAALQSIADAAGVPGSTLARSWIIERIQEEQADLTDAEAELRAAQRHLTELLFSVWSAPLDCEDPGANRWRWSEGGWRHSGTRHGEEVP